jgi:hypothetical protein
LTTGWIPIILRTMKTERISFVVKAPKQRNHRALFDRDFNFRGKRHDDKHAYKRKPKFNKWNDYDFA